MRFLFSLIVLFVLFIKAEENSTIAVVKKVNGDGAFLVINDQKTPLKSGYNITNKNAMIVTEKLSNVLLVLNNGTAIVIGENSKLNIDDELTITQEDGEVYYATKIFKPLNKIHSNNYKIKVRTALIGVRGTEFIINQSKTTNLQLSSGNITIYPINQEFEVYTKKIKNEFEQFKKGFDDYLQQIDREFNDFKEKQWEFSYKTKEFELSKNSSITIDNNKLYKEKMSDTDLEKFVLYRDIVNYK